MKESIDINLPFTNINFSSGHTMKNRFMLAPLTNKQSNEDGTLTEDERHWLEMRAKGGFGMVMTCASHVQKVGKGFEGQLGCFSDQHLNGLTTLAKSIKAHNCLSVVQLHHAGMRSPFDVIKEKAVCPSEHEKYNARALSLAEVEQLRDDFITAAIRSQKAGFDGVEVHGAHGYIITQFLSKKINQRTDKYGGSLENRSRILFEIVNGIRAKCGSNFLLGVRLSPERFGMELNEIKTIAQQLIDSNNIDFLDISLWDCKKMPEEEQEQHQTLLKHFTELERKNIKLTVAGKIYNGLDVQQLLNQGVDFVTLGRAAILHHNIPQLIKNDPEFRSITPPVSKDYLSNEGLGTKFVEYMSNWEGFVS